MTLQGSPMTLQGSPMTLQGSPMTLQGSDNSISTGANWAYSAGLLSSFALMVLSASVRELTPLVPGPLTQRAVNDRLWAGGPWGLVPVCGALVFGESRASVRTALYGDHL